MSREHSNGGGGGGGVDYDSFWDGVVRSPSLNPQQRPTKRARQSSAIEVEEDFSAAQWDIGKDWLEQGIIDNSWLEVGDAGLDASWLESGTDEFSNYLGTTDFSTGSSTSPFGALLGEGFEDYGKLASNSREHGAFLEEVRRKRKMQTGCIPCLVKGIPCDSRNPSCKRALSTDWNLNYAKDTNESSELDQTPEGMALSAYRPSTTWRRNWRERHSLNFFVNFTAPQMAGFFDSTFWQRMVIQTSYHEPAILHAITAIGALHEAIMQRAFADEGRKGKAMGFSLEQCNLAIAALTKSNGEKSGRASGVVDNRLALTTCVLFTCFEAMQGRCDSAVNHALQGRRLLQASAASRKGMMLSNNSFGEDDDVEQMRPLVERLEVQATALLDKGKRPETDTSDATTPLPPVTFIFSLDHAHNTLHTALNSIMRFMQGFHPTAPRDHIAVTMAEKYLRYAPWFQQWEQAFTAFLGESRESMVNMDFKRAMVLKANHLVGTMLASVDQSAGPVAYDPYETEFKAIVDLSREVLATFSCPPLPTLSGGATGAPYLSFSLWVTDPLWMAISRCRNPSIRQAAFTLLSQNPRQEGIWHAGPQLSNNRYMRKVETGPTTKLKGGVKADQPPAEEPNDEDYDSESEEEEVVEEVHGRSEAVDAVRHGTCNGKLVDKQTNSATTNGTNGGPRARREWVDLRANVENWAKRT
ncbi:hypothetical protein LTS12_020318 [Elasticomyces elasticus]|nr:hypothetical protein LTS12_020318 [Elasticomyces elasticus]